MRFLDLQSGKFMLDRFIIHTCRTVHIVCTSKLVYKATTWVKTNLPSPNRTKIYDCLVILTIAKLHPLHQILIKAYNGLTMYVHVFLKYNSEEFVFVHVV